MNNLLNDRVISTQRLLLRQWKDSDAEPFALMNSDERVMEHMIKPLSRGESDAFIQRIQAHFSEHGFGLWALELKSSGEFIGYTGLYCAKFKAHFTPCIEVGWRLAPAYWGQGLATEAANAVLALAFLELNLSEVVSFTTVANIRSRRVMEKLGMTSF